MPDGTVREAFGAQAKTRAAVLHLAERHRLEPGLASAYEALPYGMLLLDETGRVRYRNRIAEALITGSASLAVVQGRLTASEPRSAKRLEDALRLAGSADDALRRGGVVALAKPDSRIPLSLKIIPLEHEKGGLLDSGRSILVCAADPELPVDLAAHDLKSMLNLTPAEARVAMALFEGHSLKEAAQQLSISSNTARIHLSRIFDKTDTKRQSELIGLMTRLSMWSSTTSRRASPIQDDGAE